MTRRDAGDYWVDLGTVVADGPWEAIAMSTPVAGRCRAYPVDCELDTGQERVS